MVVNWIVIGIFILIGIIVVKMSHLKHKFLILFLILLALFFYSTISVVNEENELDFSSSRGIYNFIKIYSAWITDEYKEIKMLTGKVIKINDNSKNKTLEEIK